MQKYILNNLFNKPHIRYCLCRYFFPTLIPVDSDTPVLINIHHVWPHYVKVADGSMQMYLLVHGWNKGKFAVLKMEE